MLAQNITNLKIGMGYSVVQSVVIESETKRMEGGFPSIEPMFPSSTGMFTTNNLQQHLYEVTDIGNLHPINCISPCLGYFGVLGDFQS